MPLTHTYTYTYTYTYTPVRPVEVKMVSWMTRVLELKRGLLEVELAEQQ